MPSTAATRLLVAGLALLGLMPAQEPVVTAEVEAATAATAARQPETAARHLHTAMRALAGVEDRARGEELRAQVLAANADVDPDLERRVELESQAAARFESITRKLMAAGYPTTAGHVTQQLKLFEGELAATLSAEAKAQGEGRSDAEAKRDRALAILLSLQEVTAPSEDKAVKLEALVAEVPELGAWLDARRQFAAELQSLAKSYSKRRWYGIAWQILRTGFALDRAAIDRKLYDKLATAVSEAAAAERQRRAEPSMAQFKAGHEKFGRSKGWKISGKQWRSPKPGKNHALVLSKEVIEGDYEIEVSVRLPRPKTSFEVVVAARSPDDYLVVHCERTFGSIGEVVLAHVTKGSRENLKGFRVQGLLDSFVPMKIEIRGNQVSLDYSQQATVRLPFARDGGLRYGFALPATPKTKVQKDEAAEMRDLIVTRK